MWMWMRARGARLCMPDDESPPAPLENVDEDAAAALLEAAGEAAEADVGEVLEPLKVRNDDAAGVEVEVRQHHNTLGRQDLVGGGRRRAVGGLANHLGLDLPRQTPDPGG